MKIRPEILCWLICLFLIPGMYAVSPLIGFAQDEESASENRAEETRLRILLVAGNPAWEYRLLTRDLQRDPEVILSCWLQSMDEDGPQEGNEPLDELPQTTDELNRFDAIILLDPNPSDFSKEWMTNVREACGQGTGLMFVAGPAHSEAFSTLLKCAPIRDVLPVDLADEFDAGDGSDAPNTGTQQIRIVNDNQDHPVLDLVADESENREIWNSMPAVYWICRIVDKKADAVTLLEVADGSPLVVAGSYERGNVLFVGHSSSWRWRRVGGDSRYFQQFWRQVVRYLSQKNDR